MNESNPAFPVVGMQQKGDQSFLGVFQSGMTLRQAYKMAALSALSDRLNDTTLGPDNSSKIAIDAGHLADSMIQEDIEHQKRTKEGAKR